MVQNQYNETTKTITVTIDKNTQKMKMVFINYQYE